MSNRLIISLLIYGMVQGVLFGAGVIAVLASPLGNDAATAGYGISLVVAVSLVLAIPVAWKAAPMLRARHQRRLARKNRLGAPYPA